MSTCAPTVAAVIWDWNGTLLDDLGLCLASINVALREAGLPEVSGPQAYREAFGWPIREYYRRLGFVGDDEFRRGASRYVELFDAGVAHVGLHDGAREALTAIEGLGLRQVLISATRQERLGPQVDGHGLTSCFEAVLDTDEALDPSKQGIVARWLEASELPASQVLMVGDTNHDEEIAAELGCPFVRFTSGNQAPSAASTAPRIGHLSQLAELVGQWASTSSTGV
ncbi:HAD family hydrolase [Luteococcus sp. OSA5]|uniref:HAD family hydrolase n=1 Tax=Luteococcus sp. OSA5 TaxID=3401630 RepID=UPI003B427F9C